MNNNLCNLVLPNQSLIVIIDYIVNECILLISFLFNDNGCASKINFRNGQHW